MLTGRQSQILSFVESVLRERGASPSLREIGARFKIGFGTVQDHVKALVKKGALSASDGRHRGLAPVSWAAGLPVPVLGRVRAGAPDLAEEEVEGRVMVDPSLARGAALFALRVKGDSMRDAHIVEGDTVVVRRQPEAAPGDVVVAIKDGEATVKHFLFRGGRPWLAPANPAYRPMPAAGFEIAGKVVALVRLWNAPTPAPLEK